MGRPPFLIASGSAEATTVTIPAGHQTGDWLCIEAFRDGSATNPTIPAEWTNQTNTTDGTTCSLSVGWKRAASAAETSGTWTNASNLIVVVFRDIDWLSPIIAAAASSGTGTTVTYNTIADSNFAGTDEHLVIAFGNHKSINTTIDTPPAGMVLLKSQLGAVCDSACHYTSAPVEAWPSTNVAVGGTSSDWLTYTMILRAARVTGNNYMHAGAKSSNAGIISVAERIR